MKVIKRLLYAATAVMLLPLASCNNDEYEPAPVPDGQEAYFVDSQATDIQLTRTESTVKIPLKRIKTGEAETIQLMYEDASGLFTIPESVSFAAESNETEMTIGYDFSALERGTTYPVQLMIKGMNSPYGMSQIQLNLICPEPWNKLEGKGQFRDDILTIYRGFAGYQSEVNVYEYDGRPGYYYVENPYNAADLAPLFDASPEELVNNVRPTKFIIDATNPKAVTIGSQAEPQDCGVILNPDEGWVRVYSAQPGKLENGVITFPEKGLVGVLDVGVGECNSSGMFRVILPGYEVKDYAMGVAYGGMDVDPDNTTTKVKLNFTLGNDVTSFAYVFVEGDVVADAATIAAKIADGSAENIIKVSAEDVEKALGGSESRVMTMMQTLTRGSYTVVAVPYGADEKAYPDNAAAYMFFFPGMGEVPEVEAMLAVNSAAGLLGDASLEEKYPSTSSLAFAIQGKEIRNILYWLGSTEALDDVLAQGATELDVLTQFGSDASKNKDSNGKTWMDYINTDGQYVGTFNNLDSGYAYTMLLQVENIYGAKKILRADHTTTAIEYNGELVIGTYTMSAALGEDQFASTFVVNPTAKENEFLVKNLGIPNNAQLYATYDPSALTLTFSGLLKGGEDKGSLFGELYDYFDEEETMIYGYFTAPKWDPENLDVNNMSVPLVMNVDATTKQIKSLANCLAMLVFDAAKYGLIGAYGVYDSTTTTIVYGKPSSVARTSFEKPVYCKRALERKFSEHGLTVSQPRSLRTVAVEASVCEREAVKEFVLSSKIK